MNTALVKSWLGISPLRSAAYEVKDFQDKRSIPHLYAAIEVVLESLWQHILAHESQELISLLGSSNKTILKRDLDKACKSYFDLKDIDKKITHFVNQKNYSQYLGHDVVLLLLMTKHQHHQINYINTLQLSSNISSCLMSLEKFLNSAKPDPSLHQKIKDLTSSWKKLFPYSE